ncbi:LOW QUALITY PROTEIN: Eukaryotic translation initiation factor 4 gamma [Paramyrothecium foliicola]|nr:LOW QUALITY PROTEIN: Eukaryotic translation initiation factor 4 gamma [Paramyrothecium foliicola]
MDSQARGLVGLWSSTSVQTLTAWPGPGWILPVTLAKSKASSGFSSIEPATCRLVFRSVSQSASSSGPSTSPQHASQIPGSLMTSPANQQNPIPATNTATTAPSYASAAGAPKKPAQAPLVATGSHPPVVVGSSSASPAQNAKAASPSPVNGKSAVPPAVPAVARGSSAVNGADHSRKSSVTMAANGPSSFANGGPVGGAKSGIQFGYDSPAMAHSTPQTGAAAPIPIPGGNARVPSPAHSPSPIPQPTASGGRPPSGLQQPSGQMTFGSLSSDGERHMRQGSVPPNPNAMGSQTGTHFRRESSHSVQSDNPGGPNRANFPPQGGRGRGGFNPHSNSYNNQMGYPPNNQFRNGPGQGRGMPPAFQPQPRNMGYPNSPQPARSPALVPSMPNTPNMPPATMQPNMSMQTPPQYHYPPPMAPQHQQVRSPFPSKTIKSLQKPLKKSRREMDKSTEMGRPSESAAQLRYAQDGDQLRAFGRGQRSQLVICDYSAREVVEAPEGQLQQFTDAGPTVDSSSSNPRPFDLSPESGHFEYLLTLKHQNFGYPPQQVDQYGRPISVPYGYNNMPYMGPPQANSPGFNQPYVPPPYHQPGHSMSRTSSQQERPSSATPQNQPVIVSSTPQTQNAQPKPAGNAFVKPRRSAAIQIKKPDGEVVDTRAFKQPASPVPSIQQSKTPPVTSTPTPPPKAATPAHGRTDSQAVPKTAKEIQDELKEKIRQQVTQSQAPAEKPKEEQPVPAATAATPEAQSAPAPAEAKPAAEVQKPAEVKEDAPSKVVEEQPPKPAEPAEKPAEEQKPAEAAPAKTAAELEEEEMERIIREMEEADAKREKEEEEHRVKREAEKAAAKKLAESQSKVSAEEADRKLREQEREMERLEEEKEKKRNEAETSGKTLSVAEALAQARGAPAKAQETSNVESVADKLADMKIAEKPASPADPTGQKPEKRGFNKPAALNLAPLNTKQVEPPQPSAALQSLKSARFLHVMDQEVYPEGILSPNPALNAAVSKKGKTFKYDAQFLLQFQKVFTEQPSLEFHQQVKSLIGDGDGGRSASGRGVQTPGSARQGSSRGGGFPGSSMGSFNAPPGRTAPLPSGLTSEQRFAMSNNSSRPGSNPMGSFPRGPGNFPGTTPLSRTPSQANNPNSPRTSRRGDRGSRRGDFNAAKEDKAAKTMPLTAGQELKPIAVTASGWKPTSVGRAANPAVSAPTGYLDPELVQRKVKAALNKMTPEKFDKISDQILEISSQSKDESDGRTLRQVIQLTFEKATDEAHWASMYAKFCKRMLETMSPDVRDERIKDKNGNIVSGGNLFRKYLLNRCQEEFERGWTTTLPEAPKEGEEAAAAAKEGDKTGDAVMLSDEYYAAAAAKRRGLGLVQFIGELYKLGMLTERIMHECVRKLVDYKGVPDEAEIESLCKLLRTIGANLDATEKGRPMMDAYFQRIQTMADLPELQSRMRFMLLDVIDLRRANWHSKEANKGPKTLEEVRAEAEAQQAAKAQENARNSQRGGGRPQAGRGDARNFSAGYQQTSNQVGMDDLRRLKGSASRLSSQSMTLGPTSMFSSRSNSGRRLGPGGSLGRPGEDSGASSRTGTPPTRENTSHSNAFSLLANMETENPASPPSTSASPSISKAVPDSDKKESE